MGLLDWSEEVDDFSFPNFDASFTPSTSPRQASPLSKPFGSFSTTQSSNASLNTTTSTTSSASSSSLSSSKAHKHAPYTRKTRARGNSQLFDLFGEDEELQEAEPKIAYCDVCMKHCDIH